MKQTKLDITVREVENGYIVQEYEDPSRIHRSDRWVANSIESLASLISQLATAAVKRAKEQE